MFDFPVSTLVDKRITKEKLYEHIDTIATIKKVFIEQVKSIRWLHKIAETTINIAKGVDVEEIEIFHIVVKNQDISNCIFTQIDKVIPYNNAYLLEFENTYKLKIGFRHKNESGTAFKVDRYYETEWLPENKISLELIGLNLDTVYENIIRQIAGDFIAFNTGNLIEDIIRTEQENKITKEIARLEKQARNEKQPKKKFELVSRIAKLKKEV